MVIGALTGGIIWGGGYVYTGFATGLAVKSKSSSSSKSNPDNKSTFFSTLIS